MATELESKVDKPPSEIQSNPLNADSDAEFDSERYLGVNTIATLCNLDNNDEKVGNKSADIEIGDPHIKEKYVIIAIAYILCCVSTLFAHVLRKPLATAKVNIQNDLNVPVYQLGYLDTSFLLLYTIAQLLTPIIFPKSHSIIILSLLHIIISLALLTFYFCESITYYIIVYGILGFACAPVWTLVFQDLHIWLPNNYKIILITIWSCTSEIGSMLGMVIYVRLQSITTWHSMFVLSSILNMVVGIFIFSFYTDPKFYVSNPSSDTYKSIILRRMDPIYIINNNFYKIRDYFNLNKPILGNSDYVVDDHTNNDSKLTTTNADTWIVHKLKKNILLVIYKCKNGVTKVFTNYKLLINKVKFLNHSTFAITFVRITRYSFSFWISFYVTTYLGYSIQDGNYSTLMFEIGSCTGTLTSGLIHKFIFKNKPVTSSTIWSLVSAIAIITFGSIKLETIFTIHIFIFIIGLVTNATDALFTTQCIKSICEYTPDYTERDFSVACGYVFTVSTLCAVVQCYFSAFIVHLVGWNVFFTYLGVLIMIGTGVMGISAKYEIDRIKAMTV